MAFSAFHWLCGAQSGKKTQSRHKGREGKKEKGKGHWFPSLSFRKRVRTPRKNGRNVMSSSLSGPQKSQGGPGKDRRKKEKKEKGGEKKQTFVLSSYPRRQARRGTMGRKKGWPAALAHSRYRMAAGKGGPKKKRKGGAYLSFLETGKGRPLTSSSHSTRLEKKKKGGKEKSRRANLPFC